MEDNIFLAMEYFPLGTLDKFISEDLKEDGARLISAQLLEGLKIMHEEGFTHRDLKPQVGQPPQIITQVTSEYHTHHCRISSLYKTHPVGGSKLETLESANAFRMMIQLCTNPKRSSLDQMKGLSTSIMLPDLSHEADLTPQLRVMPGIIQPLTTKKVALEDFSHATNPFLLSSSPLSSLVRQNRANPAPGTVKRTDTESTSNPLKDWADQASGALHQVGANPASKVAKSTEEGPFPSETEFSRLDFHTWVSRDSASTISPATVVKNRYADLDRPTNKVPKGENHGFDGSYSKNLSSAEIQTETFPGLLLDLNGEQPIYNGGQRPPLNDDDLLRAYNADYDESQFRPSISYDEFVGVSTGGHPSPRTSSSKQ
jgi:serine/threonine protein kinase